MIDFAGVEEAFAASVDGTVGIEEEYALLDPASLDLVPRYEGLRDAATGPLAESISGELISSEIEIRSGRGEDLADALERQREHRCLLVELADRHGVALGSQGTHPWADYREQPNIDTEHYRRVVEGLRWVARRNNTFSLHVHVGVRDAERAVAVCDRLRPVVPTLLAIGANSVGYDGLDSGLHSARTQMFTKTFPRCGVPDHYGSWAAYRDYIALLERTRSIVEYTQVWWSIRPHFAFGTVEVRICDAQTTSAESDALTRLITACVARAARDQDEGVPFAALPNRLIEENMWRAIRHGLDGRLLDLEAGTEIEAATAVERLLAWADVDPGLPALNGAQRVRRALDHGASWPEVYAGSVHETKESLREHPACRAN